MSTLQRFLASALVLLSAALGRAATTDLAGNAIQTAGLTPSGAWETYLLQVAPTVTTASATNLASTSVTLGGEVTADGAATVTERGIVYSTSNATPTISDTKVAIGTGTGTFSQSVTGLAASTTYYVRAYATNSVGTSYGSAITVNTLAPAPVITSGATASGTYGSNTFSYTIAASNSPTSFSSSTLPPGLTLNTGTGTITGTPTDTSGSPYSVTIGATNGAGTGTATLTITINKRIVLVSASTQFSAATKVYDGTAAVLNLTKPGTVTFTGKFGTDDVSVDHTNAVGTFASKDVGNRSATISGLVLTGAAASNYSLTVIGSTPAVAITAKSLTVSGLSAVASRVYDGNMTAGLTGTAALQSAITAGSGTAADGAPYSVDSVSLAGTATGAFSDRHVGVDKAVTITGLSLTGTGSTNYTLAPVTGLTANVTAKPLTVTGIVVSDKEYDGGVDVTFNTSGAALDGVVSGESVALNLALASASFGSKTVGTNKAVQFANIALAATGDWANYSLTQPTATANITAKAITVSGVLAQSKTYDRSTSATLDLSGATLTGVVVNDSVTLDSGSATGTFASKDVGTGIAVTVSGLSISSSGDGANYTLNQPTGLTAGIAAKGLTVSGVTAASKTYDGSTSATVDTSAAALVGVVGGDTVNLATGSASGTFDNKNAGTNKTVTVAGLSIGTTGDATNYTLAQPTATASILAKELTVSGITAGNRAYDGTTIATLNTASAALVGIVGSESVTLNTASAAGAFASKDVGTGKTVTVSGLSIGSTGDAANYSLTQPTVTANIAATALTVSGVTASDKPYDGNTTATLNTASAALVGVVGSDSVSLSSGGATGTFDTKNVGANKTVTVAGLSIGSTGDAANYSLTQPTTTAAITAKTLTVSGIAAASKTYDGSTTAVVDTSSASLVGVVGGETVSLATSGVSGTFDTKNVGTNKTVTIAGLSIGTTGDAVNYTLTQPTTTAGITARSLTVTGVTASDKTYDGGTTATLNTAGAALAGVISGENVTLATGGATGAFDTKNVGPNKTVTVAGLSIGSTGDAANYSLAQPTTTASITAKELTVSGVVAGNKTYDGNTSATLNTAGAALVGVVTGETVTLGVGTATGTFDTKNVGANKTVTVAGLSIGSTGDAANYSLTQPTTTAAITAKTLTVSGVAAASKTYDGSTTAVVDTSSAALVGVIGGETVSLATSGVSGTFDTKNVGTNKTVTVAGLSIGTTGDAVNYTLTQPTTTAGVTARPVTVTGVTASDKTYDGNTTATLNTAGAALVGVISGENVALATGGATGAFDTKNVGANKTITVAGLSIGSTGDAANYSLTQPTTTAAITAKELTVSGLAASNKTYDGNTSATLNTAGVALVGVVTGETVTLAAGGATAAFDTKNVGTNKTVTVAGLSIGSTGDAANYSLTQPTTTASITAKELTVSGVAVANKTYDGNTTASVVTTNAVLVGVISGETVTLGTGTATGTFDTKNIGTNKAVTIAGLSIGTTGDAANYSLTQPTTTANVTAKALTITGVTALNRTYNASTVATLDTSVAALAGVVTGESVTLNKSGATATFADKNIGTMKPVTTTGFAIEGTDVSNYTLTQPAATAEISRKALTINGVSASNKVYDRTITATLTGTPALGAPTVIGGNTADGNPYASDVVGLTGTMSGAFSDRHAGNGKIVTVSGLTLEGGDAGNYLVTALTASANITPKPLTITGLSATDRVYDATTVAPLTGTPALATAQATGTGTATDGAPYLEDTVSLAGAAVGAFGNAAVATGKAVTITGLTLTGDDAANYTPTQPAGLTAAVTVKTLTVAGLTAGARVYDGTVIAPLSGTPALQATIDAGTGTNADGKPFTGDDVSINGTASGVFADRHAAAAKSITIGGLSLSGAQAANYLLQHPTTLTADVTPKALSSGGLAGVARIYDGTLTAPLTGTAVLGTAQSPGAGATTDGMPYTGDTLSISGAASGAFADRHVGTGKPVTISGLMLGGSESANYTLAQPTGVTGTVTPKALSVQGLAGATRVYDATTSGPLSGAAALLAAQAPGAGTTADGKPYTGDTVAVAGTAAATFADKLVGTAKPLTVTGITLTGADATNYSITQPAALTATITPKELTVTGVQVATKVFNGDTGATLDFAAAALVGIAGSDTVTLVTTGATGTYSSSNAGGSIPVAINGLTLAGADAGNYLLSQPAATGSIMKAGASVSLGNLAQTYNGSPRSVSVTTSPVNLNTAVTYGGSSGAPTNAGSYGVSASISDANYEGGTSGTLTIAKATQSVTIGGPTGTLTAGTAFGISASASSGLPVTLSIVSGAGSLSGSSLTLTSTAPVTVRATQAGDTNHEPASAERTFTATAATKQPQTIAFDPISNRKTTDAAFGISAVATSGLPVSFSIVSGPALVSGSTVTLTGASGAVIVRASQPGNASFDAAPDVTQSFNVIGTDAHQVFFGVTQNNDTVAIDLAPDGTSGTLLCYIGASGEAFIVTFTINPDGTFDAAVIALGGNTPAASATGSAPARAAATPPRTFRGRLVGNTITGSIVELGVNFTTTLQPRTGPTAAISGLYQSSPLNSAGGRTASIVGTEGQVLVVASTATISTGGTGAVTSEGTFTVQATGATIAGAVDAPTTTVSGTILVPNQPAVSFSGIASTTVRTDRLINLSSRARIGPAAGRTLITGFVIGGSDAKRVLLRAVGPALGGFGVTGAIPNPRLQLYNSQGVMVLENDDWSGAETAAAFGQVGAFTLSNGARDAALLTTLAPGAYTMHVIDGGDTGVALAEIYDASPNPQGEYQRLINISSRGTVEGGDGVLIGGFVVTGNSPKKVLVRGVGPALAGFGVAGTLTDPRLAIYSGSTLIATNNDWSTPTAINSTQVVATAAEIADVARATGAFALGANSRDAALVITLAPGAYTAQVSAADGATGVALVEIYELPE